ncbi:MAG: sulfurtransferase TusA family protein [Deltaproteobacteria bacterium]|jgi:TusA-related sulfurtransferase|nr:sulfurtransferase TusA family protein [Deltaproteobacteria bacterium]MDR1297732.1 sulfurtransferase TusA family protein [Deltaproteobacteria bacterium]
MSSKAKLPPPDGFIDATDVVCPMTFVKAKVALEEMDMGGVLSIRLNEGEPLQNVPRSLKDEGQQVLGLQNNEDGTYNLLVRRAAE